MTREFIENYRKILIPFMKKWLSETNYENLGESDAEEFEKDFNEICDLAIKALEQEPKWIPVSERLPDTDDEVLCWYEYYHWSQEKVLPEYGLGRYLRETSAWFGKVANGKDVRVIAWMPLPEPYESQEKEDK